MCPSRSGNLPASGAESWWMAARGGPPGRGSCDVLLGITVFAIDQSILAGVARVEHWAAVELQANAQQRCPPARAAGRASHSWAMAATSERVGCGRAATVWTLPW